ncbi:MAG: DNA repair protein RecO [Myxococcales bacterium]|nr:DNA repair protein RecO [Myxococcales bacterium]
MEEPLRGLLLKRVAYGDADLILTILTHERGLFSCYARSARRQKRGWSGLLSPGNSLVFHLSGRRRSGLASLRHLTLSKDRSRQLASPTALARAAYYLDLARRVTVEDAPAEDFLSRLEFALDRIEEPGVTRYIEWASVEQLGVLPDLEHCGDCGADLLVHGALLSMNSGGLLCHACGHEGLAVSANTLIHLGDLTRGELVTEVNAERALAQFLGQMLLEQLGVLESRRQAARYASL